MTIKNFLEESIGRLKKAGIASARLDSELLCAYALGRDRVWLVAHDTHKLSADELKTCQQLINKRAKRIPLSYITSHKEFYSLDFYVDKRVLTPRNETELIATEVIKNIPPRASLVDVGTGSGALAVAIKYHRPDINVSASEISTSALKVARRNAEQIIGKNHDINLIESNLFDKIVGKFDVITANLPYVSTDYKPRMMAEVKHEPEIALFGGPNDGLNLYRQFFKQAPDHLNKNSLIYLESDPWQHEAIIALAKEAGLRPIFQNYLILGFGPQTDALRAQF